MSSKKDKKSKKDSDSKSLTENLLDHEHIYSIPDINSNNQKAIQTLKRVSIICVLFMIVEIAGGVIANSLAIMTDAAHLFSDISGFFISIFSLKLSQLPAN